MTSNYSLVFFLVFVSLIMTGQEPIERPPLNPSGISKWSSDGFSYTDFGTQEQHSYFSILYEINPKLYAEVQGFYDTYRIADIFDVSARMKWYPSEKVYLFSGLGVQLVRSKGFGDGVPTMPVRMLNGVGYETNKNITIEAVHDLNFSNNGAPSLFTLKGKYRF